MTRQRARFIARSKAKSPDDQAAFDARYDTHLDLICEPEGVLGA